jgi:EmrB/QacA subfamily drug resistance transporter
MRAILAPLVAIIIGLFMAVLDGTAMNVAIPSLVRDFNSTLSTLQWTVTGYALAQAAVIPLAGWLSDRFGAKQLFITSIAVFTIGSVLCAMAQSSTMLIAFRVLQGMGGGFVWPVGLAFVYRLAPPERVGAVMGLMGIPVLFAPAIGPVVAGWLVDHASWRWIFLLNLPVGIVGVLAGLRSLPALARQQTPRLDLPGTLLAPLAFAALVYGVSQGATSWTATTTVAGVLVGAAALAAFMVVELRAEQPLLELRVFRSLDFNMAIVAQCFAEFVMFGALFLVPQVLESVRGYSALDTGLSLLPQALGAAIFLPLGGALFDRIGARPLVLAGGVLMAAAGCLLVGIDIHTQGRDLIAPLFLYGMGIGLGYMSLTTQTINAAPRELVGRVTSLTSALMQVINALSVALLTTFLIARPSYNAGQRLLIRFQTEAQAAASHAQQAGHVAAPASTTLPDAVATLFVHAFDDTFALLAIMGLIAGLLGLALRRQTAAQRAAAAANEAEAAPEPLLMAG